MNKKSCYDLFIGLLSLMVSIMIMLDIIISLPRDVIITFHYISTIVWYIFLLDYIIKLIISKGKVIFTVDNIIDLLSLITIDMYIYILDVMPGIHIRNLTLIIGILKMMRLTMLLIKFNCKIKNQVKINRFFYMLILTSMVIIVSALFISILENMSFSDALWWSFVTFTTVGYGDVMLRTGIGRIVAVVLMIFGIGFIGITTSTLAVYIINGGVYRRKKNVKRDILDNIKHRIDNFDTLSDNDIDDIYKILKSLKNNK